jgi:hypothetical protein
VAVFEPEAEGIVFDAEDTGGDIVGRSPWRSPAGALYGTSSRSRRSPFLS